MTLPELIAKIESANNQYAIRFEPHVYARDRHGVTRDVARKVNKCSVATARVIMATSWSLYQIMGFNLYGFLGLTIPVLEFAARPDLQAPMFRKFCEVNGIWRDGDIKDADDDWLMKFARAYNGPGNPTEYVRRMKEQRS